MQPHELVRTLTALAQDGETGALRLTSGQESFAILFNGGQIVELEGPGTAVPDLVEMLRLLGRIPRSRAAILRRLTGQNVAAALVVMREWGTVSPADMQRRAEFRMSQAIARALGWGRVTFAFDETAAIPEAPDDAREALDMQRILAEAVAMVDEWSAALSRASAQPLTRESTVRWLPDFTGDIAHLNLGADAIHILCLANGQFPIHEMAYGLLLSEAQVAQITQRLIDMHLVGLVDPE